MIFDNQKDTPITQGDLINLVTKKDLKLIEIRIKDNSVLIDQKFSTVRQEIKTSMLTAILSTGGMIAIATGFLRFFLR